MATLEDRLEHGLAGDLQLVRELLARIRRSRSTRSASGGSRRVQRHGNDAAVNVAYVPCVKSFDVAVGPIGGAPLVTVSAPPPGDPTVGFQVSGPSFRVTGTGVLADGRVSFTVEDLATRETFTSGR